MAAFEAKIGSPSNNASAGPLIWEIPVRVSVFRKNDGSGWGIYTYDNAFIDAFLFNMNAKMAGGPNNFHFFRCGPINYIDVNQLYNGSLPPQEYSYNRNFLNLYIYYKPGEFARATFPWYPEPQAVWMPSGIEGTSDAVGFHELGHTLGLAHPFSPEASYSVPVDPSQSDHPDKQGGREIMITVPDPNKEFGPNGGFAGDRVSDTPPGCDSHPQFAAFYPSSATIAGCLDNDPNTPCINGCLDGNPATPCINGCSWDYTNCTYTGDYRDYNFDLVVDSLNVLARNIMSYTGSCRQNFTPGQISRADMIANFQLNDYYREELCGSLLDRVEIEGTNIGLNRVKLRISPSADPADYTQTIVNTNGDFSGKLPVSNVSVQVRANVERFRSSDVTKLDNDWLSGLTTFDLTCIQRYILGQVTLDGYKILAADANKSNTISPFDIILFRRLILGIDTDLAAYNQPWRFIPEIITQNVIGGGLQPDFDGIGNDNPFMTVPPAMGGPAVAPTEYCEPTWPFLMRSGTVRNGFDAVKLGNICGEIAPGELQDECPGDDVALLVPNVSVAQGDVVELDIKGYGFQSVTAFQTGIRAPKDEFEFINKGSGSIGDFGTTETAPGDLNQVEEGIRAVWIHENLTPQILADGSSLFKVTLRAKENILDLRQALILDKKILETYFLTADGSCISNVSIEISVNNLGSDGRGSQYAAGNTLPTQQKIFCLPNPASDRLTVLFDADEDFDGNLLVHDMQGRLLQTVAHQFLKGRNVINLSDFARFPEGMLNISVFDGKSIHTIRANKK